MITKLSTNDCLTQGNTICVRRHVYISKLCFQLFVCIIASVVVVCVNEHPQHFLPCQSVHFHLHTVNIASISFISVFLNMQLVCMSLFMHVCVCSNVCVFLSQQHGQRTCLLCMNNQVVSLIIKSSLSWW